MATVGIEVLLFSLVAAVGWGIGPIFAKLGMASGGRSTQATLLVLLVGAVVFWISTVSQAGGLRVFTGVRLTTILLFVASGVFGSSLGWLLWFYAVDEVGASVGNVVFYTQPMFAALLAVLFLGERLTVGILVGILLVFGGVALLSLSSGGDVDSWSRWALAFPLGASISVAIGTVLNRYGLSRTNITVIEALTVSTTTALVLMVAYFVVTRDWRSMLTYSRSDGYFVLNGLTHTVAFFALFTALDNGPVVIVSPVTSTSPLFTALIAHVALSGVERVTIRTVVSALLTVAGLTAIVLL